jgi:hypothetical protein
MKGGVLLCVLLCQVALADQIVFKNGDRITGSVVKKDGKTITVKADNFGVVTAPWDQVESITVAAPVTVVLQNGKTAQGTIATAGGKVEVTAKDQQLSAAPAEVVTIRNADEEKAYERLLNPSMVQLWTLNGSLGLAGTAGNAKTETFTLNFNAARVTSHDKTTVYFNTIDASAFANGVTSKTAEAVRGGWAYDHQLSGRFFFNTFNDYEFDRFQNLDLRFAIGGGAGYSAVKSDRARLDVLGGADYDHSHFDTPLTRSSAEAFWGDVYSYKLNSRAALTQSFRMFNTVSGGGAYRVNGDLGLTSKLTKWLTWNLSLSDRFLSDPAPGRKTNDFLYTTGLGFTFAH